MKSYLAKFEGSIPKTKGGESIFVPKKPVLHNSEKFSLKVIKHIKYNNFFIFQTILMIFAHNVDFYNTFKIMYSLTWIKDQKKNYNEKDLSNF